MNKAVLITTLDKVFDEKLAAAFIREGYATFAIGNIPVAGVILLPLEPEAAAAVLKEQTGKLDYFLDTTDIQDEKDTFSVRDGIQVNVIERIYRQNILRTMALLEAFLPLLDEGEGKRLFYLTRAEASINETRRVDHFGYNMTKAALHQFIQMTWNKLSPSGYTLRVFDPMDREVSPEAAAESAYNYIVRRRGTENHDPKRDDENNIVFRDAQGRLHAW